jgi:hypothetical protein
VSVACQWSVFLVEREEGSIIEYTSKNALTVLTQTEYVRVIYIR